MSLLRVCVVDRASYAPLFDWQVSRWEAENARAPRDAAALLQFFFQLAKDVQGGDVVRVEFERPVVEAPKHRNAFARGVGIQPFQPRHSLAVRKRQVNPLQALQQQPSHHFSSSLPSAASPQLSPSSSPSNAAAAASSSRGTQRIEMYCADSPRIILAVFVTQEFDGDGAGLAAKLRDLFLTHFTAKLDSAETGMGQLAGMKEASSFEGLMPHFTGFREVVEKAGLLRVEKKAAALPAPLNTQGSMTDLSSPLASPVDHGYSPPRAGYAASSMPLGQGRVLSTSPPDYGSSFLASHAHVAAEADHDYMPAWLLADSMDPLLHGTAAGLPHIGEEHVAASASLSALSPPTSLPLLSNGSSGSHPAAFASSSSSSPPLGRSSISMQMTEQQPLSAGSDDLSPAGIDEVNISLQ